uniref:SCP domain-containing protein n=1 Tax=Mesocestoides corti TaxID=53468 RepID=A0A5K3F7L7_MESCO
MLKLVCITALLWKSLAEVPSEQEREYILKLHTDLREQVDPPASNMLMLSYSFELEKLANAHVARCTSSSPDGQKQPEYNGLGLVTKVGEQNKLSSFEELSILNHERLQYDYETNSCKEWCYFYKQAVWANNSEIGCAKHSCISGDNGKSYRYRVACLYRYTGNIIKALPYERGESCTRCPKKYVCEQNQCAKQSAQRSTSSSKASAPTRPSALGFFNAAVLILFFLQHRNWIILIYYA